MTCNKRQEQTVNYLTRCVLVLALSLSATGIAAQSNEQPNKISFSLDVGSTYFEPFDQSVAENLDFLGTTDVRKWESRDELLAGQLGFNVHYKNWSFGIEAQLSQSSQFEVYGESSVDRVESSENWLSLHTERAFNIRDNTYAYVGGGISHTNLTDFVVRSGEDNRMEIKGTDPFLRLGVGNRYRFFELRADWTSRSTHSDNDGVFRITMRIPFK